MWHGERLHRDVANRKLGTGLKNSPIPMSLQEPAATKRFRRKPITIDRHFKFPAENFKSADVIGVFVSKEDAIKLLWHDLTLRQT